MKLTPPCPGSNLQLGPSDALKIKNLQENFAEGSTSVQDNSFTQATTTRKLTKFTLHRGKS